MAKDSLSPPSYCAQDPGGGTVPIDKAAFDAREIPATVTKNQPWWQKLVKHHRRGQHKGKPLQAPTVAPATKADGIIVCPHETLSWTAFQRILDLPGFLEEGAKLCALSPYPPEHSSGERSKEVLNVCTMENVVVRAHYSYGRDKGALLCRVYLNTAWDITYPGSLPTTITHGTFTGALKEYHEKLQKMAVNLCSHIRLHDATVVIKTLDYLTASQISRDPIGQWIAQNSSKPFELPTCERCGMIMAFCIISANPPRFLIKTRKDLGNGTHRQGGPDKAWKKHLKH